MKRSASAFWEGGIKDGSGKISSESGVLREVPYSFSKRFGDERGTNPEELIGAAHSGCFAMAFSGELEKLNLRADSINVTAEVSIGKEGEGFSISDVHLNVITNVPGGSYEQVQRAAKSAKENCPVSKLLKANITMDLQIQENTDQPSM